MAKKKKLNRSVIKKATRWAEKQLGIPDGDGACKVIDHDKDGYPILRCEFGVAESKKKDDK